MNYVCLSILFGLILGYKSENSIQKFDSIVKNQCIHFDASEIGLIYLFLPFRQIHELPYQNIPSDGITFNTHHFYSLLTLTHLFKPTSNNRILFFYINNSGEPLNNHYNQWLNDTYWNSKIPIDSIQFIKLEHNTNRHFNLVEIINQIKLDSPKLFDRPKEKFLLMTSDMIIGPKIQSCFSHDILNYDLNTYDIYNVEYIKSKTQYECYKLLNEENIYSFLYRLDYIHSKNDFSGILLWNNKHNENVPDKLINLDNVYKCTYQSDILKNQKALYEDSFCIFGFELNAYEPPVLQDLFQQDNNYFNKIIRKILYNNSEPIKYRQLETEVIPNIVHLIWFSSSPFKSLKFIEYLTLKSLLYFVKPDKIKIHGDQKPYQCKYWNELSQNPKIEWVHRERPLFKYNQNFTSSPIQHLADVARLEVLYEEGGIYSDFDILWVKPLDKFRYLDVDLVASNDITSYCTEFPFNVQIGAFLAPKKSQFLKLWLDGYRDKYHLFPGDYVAVSMCEPYKLYEKLPRKVFIDNRLQMIFFNGWSSFIPRYIDIEQEKLKDFTDNLDWLNDGAHGYHLPRHGSLYTREDFDKSDKNALPIRIATYILNLEI
ncbi:unnamed protein product [Brachionus calyciflorus]|uniref:Glycosyltransferase n=1 Tax=Brachionus calyciflorus TaxID=104777 RepID=A0A813MSJ7_9BILA|nr:unnamed protein product [Brachionus calyciflorus]